MCICWSQPTCRANKNNILLHRWRRRKFKAHGKHLFFGSITPVSKKTFFFFNFANRTKIIKFICSIVGDVNTINEVAR